MSAASRCSMSLRCIMWTRLPSLNNANDGEDGGYPVKYERARSVASISWPAKTLNKRSGRAEFCKAVRTAGRRRPAAQPQIEFTITRVVPCAACNLLSTSFAVFNSSTPKRVRSSRMGITIISGYISHPEPSWPELILQFFCYQYPFFTRLTNVQLTAKAKLSTIFGATELDFGNDSPSLDC